MSAPYKKVGVLWKNRCPIKKSASYEKVGVHWKSLRPMKKSASYEKVVSLWKSWRPIKKSAPDEKVGALWKSRRPTQWDIKIYNNYRMWPPYCLARQTPQWPLSSAPAGSPSPGGVVPFPPCVVAECPWPLSGQLIWVDCPHTGPPWLYRLNVGFLLKRRRPFEITYFLMIQISSTRPRIKKL